MENIRGNGQPVTDTPNFRVANKSTLFLVSIGGLDSNKYGETVKKSLTVNFYVTSSVLFLLGGFV